jgi:hypothetical protein
MQGKEGSVAFLVRAQGAEKGKTAITAEIGFRVGLDADIRLGGATAQEQEKNKREKNAHGEDSGEKTLSIYTIYPCFAL